VEVVGDALVVPDGDGEEPVRREAGVELRKAGENALENLLERVDLARPVRRQQRDHAPALARGNESHERGRELRTAVPEHCNGA
jgi:hypothetical protein